MYQIDQNQNRIKPLTAKRFTDLGFKERQHLQEWLAHQPQALGEDLLIIQKEFDGFDDTQERLDLLALDKQGRLVIVENKLDDSGKDVVWQAIKYASYCANLSKSNIIEIYQRYLDKYDNGKNAQEMLQEFFEVGDVDELVLNPSTQQRLMFVAAYFRKEVTSTALWLLANGIDVTCFKVTPYEFSGQLFLNIEQIIPTPEAREFMIGIAEKETEEKKAATGLLTRHKLRLAFWELALNALSKSPCALYKNISPSKDHWLSAGSGLRAVPYNLIFGEKMARVELCIARPTKEECKFIFDEFYKHQHDIESQFGGSLDWQRLDSRKSCRISLTKEFDGYNSEMWTTIIAWMIQNISQLEYAFKPYIAKINRKIKDA